MMKQISILGVLIGGIADVGLSMLANTIYVLGWVELHPNVVATPAAGANQISLNQAL